MSFNPTIYQKKSFVENEIFMEAIRKARIEWDYLTKEYVKSMGGENKLGGSCIGGAGFKVAMLHPRCRIKRYSMILSAPRGYQSDSCYATKEILDKVKKILLDAGIDCWYNDGYMV